MPFFSVLIAAKLRSFFDIRCDSLRYAISRNTEASGLVLHIDTNQNGITHQVGHSPMIFLKLLAYTKVFWNCKVCHIGGWWMVPPQKSLAEPVKTLGRKSVNMASTTRGLVWFL